MAAKKTVTATKTIDIVEPNLARAIITVVGETPLVMKAISQRTREAMVNKVFGGEVDKTKVRDRQQEFNEAIYRSKDEAGNDQIVFPARGVKKALVQAARSTGATMTATNQFVQIDGVWVPVQCSQAVEAIETPRQKTGDLAVDVRASIFPWAMDVPVTYLANVISLQQIVYLFTLAGFCVGFGVGRPENGGTNGRFSVLREGK